MPNNASNFSLAATPSPLTNCAANNGAINLNITPLSAYSYQWSNAATTEDLSGLDTTVLSNSATLSISTPGTYYLLAVNPANNCANSVSTNVTADQTPPTAKLARRSRWIVQGKLPV